MCCSCLGQSLLRAADAFDLFVALLLPLLVRGVSLNTRLLQVTDVMLDLTQCLFSLLLLFVLRVCLVEKPLFLLLLQFGLLNSSCLLNVACTHVLVECRLITRFLCFCVRSHFGKIATYFLQNSDYAILRVLRILNPCVRRVPCLWIFRQLYGSLNKLPCFFFNGPTLLVELFKNGNRIRNCCFRFLGMLD